MLCESRRCAKRATAVVLVNPLKVVLPSPFDEKTSLERLSNFSKVLLLEMPEPAMELYLSKPEFLILTLEFLSQEEVRGVCFQNEQSPHLRNQSVFPRDPVCSP